MKAKVMTDKVMNEFDDLEQKLWELEYGLLPDDEASALRQRIADEPAVALAHGRVCAQSALVAEAARVEVPRIHLQRTTLNVEHSIEPRTSSGQDRKSRFEYRQIVNWAIAAAATLLLAMLGSAFIRKDQTEFETVAVFTDELATASAAEPVKIEAQGAQVMQPEIENRISFFTSTPGGVPQSATLKVQMKDAEGNVKLDAVVPTDRLGRGSVVMPADVVAEVSKMEVAEVDRNVGLFAVPLAKAPGSYVTFLATDRPRYRPGDTVRYRSVTLSKFGLTADRDMDVNFAITDPTGNPIATANQSGTTTKGVGNGEFTVSEDSAGGQYTLVAQNSSNLFPPANRGFYVQPDETRKWNLNVAWQDSLYGPGTNPKAKVVVQTLDGQPAADVPVRAEAYVDGHQVNIPDAPSRTSSQGAVDFSIPLPAEISFGEGTLNVALGDEEFQIEQIPIRVPKVVVDFYPEGGDLVAGLNSRVYFHAHDALGRAVNLRGRIIDGKKSEVVSLATQHEGRGMFRLTPRASEVYVLEITDPPQSTTDSRLPPINEHAHVVLDCGPGVFGANDPVAPRIVSTSPPPENLIVVAKCRDAMVGHVSVSSADFVNGSCDAALQLAAEAAGVIRITVFEHDQPLAERLVFRQGPNRLSVQVEGTETWYAPASQVRLALYCENEKGAPASAALGVGVVDNALLKLARPAIPRMATHFWLFGDVDSPEKLEDANFYVADSAESRAALDLLLGTQGWRRFERMSESRLAADSLRTQDAYAMGMGKGMGMGTAGKSALQLGATPLSDEQQQDGLLLNKSLFDRTTDLPFRVDNSASLEQQPQQAGLSNPQPNVLADRSEAAETTTRSGNRWIVTIASAIGLMAFSLFAILLQLASSRRIAIGGMVTGAIVLTVATYMNLAPIGSRENAAVATASPSRAPSGGVAGSSSGGVAAGGSAGVAADFETVPALKEKLTAEGFESKLSENSPAPTAAPIPPPAAVADPAWRVTKDESESARPAPKSAATPAAPQVRQPEQEPSAKPGQAGAEAKAVAEKAMAPAPDLPVLRAARAGADTSAVPREEAAIKDGLAERFRSQSLLRQKNADLSQQGSRARRMSEIEKGAQLSQQLRSDAQQQVELKSAVDPSVDPSASTRASGKSFGRGNDNDFLVRRYAYQQSPKKAADKKPADYTETVYWNPLLITDANGRAEIVFDLSDAATTYQVLIDGHHEGRISSTTDEIKTKAP